MPANKSKTKGRWKKGESGNPNGRPKIPEDVKEAFKNATPKAIETLQTILDNPEARDGDKIRAAEIILDRAWGKPTQSMELDGKVDTAPTVITFAGELDEWSK